MTLQVDYWEVNEAFSVVDVANRQLLGLPADRCVSCACQRTALLLRFT